LKFLGLLDRPAERGALVIKIGMMLYDLYTRAQKTVPPHLFRGRRASLERFPDLNPDVLFTGTYFDGTMPSPERICIELIQDAIEHAGMAWCANYLAVDDLQGDRVVLKDRVTDERLHVQPEIVINAGGPWVDHIHESMGIESQMIGGTKGSHIILEHPELSAAIDGHEFFFENKDGRIVLINPLRDKVMIGTTDIRITDPDQAVCTEDEIDYFFEMVARVFPGITLHRSQILYTFSGVRPLPSSPQGFTGQISRDHSIEMIPAGKYANFPILALVGGKWTSFRAFAEQTTDRILGLLGVEREVDTRSRISGGSREYPSAELRWEYLEALSDRFNTAANQVEVLFSRYGSETVRILSSQRVNGELTGTPIPGYYLEELKHLIKEEDVVHLDDLILRRTMIAKLGLLTKDTLTPLAELVAQEKGWTPEVTADEIARAKTILHEHHRLQL
jgi:glycerol-3-phosphate dehydrogenase